MKIGFIGQGFIGSSYADDFESRGFDVVRYAREEKYVKNKDIIAKCDIVFIAVPTPTTPDGFSYEIVQSVLPLIGKGKTAVIKSTVLPGTTEKLQEEFPDIYLTHSPEFLRAVTAKEDAAHPHRNIVGYTAKSKSKAQEVIDVLPKAEYSKILPVKTAELIKYVGNVFLTQKVLFANTVYDLAEKIGANYDEVREAVGADTRITQSHLAISHDGGRGAGGYCFIKDLAAFSDFYKEMLPKDSKGISVFESLEEKNIQLLKDSKKDIDLLEGVYGKDV